MKKEFGFTLIEVILVVFLVGALSLVVSSLFLGQDKIYHTQMMEFGVTSDARTALDDIDAYVRSADVVLATYGSYTTGSQTLILQVPSVNASSQIIPATFDFVVFKLNGSTLNQITTANAASTRVSGTRKLATRVTGLVFSYDNSNKALVKQVTTDLTAEESYPGVPSKSITVSSKSKLRNN